MTGIPDVYDLDRRTLLRSLGVGSFTSTAAATPASADEADAEHYHNPVGPVGFGDVTAIRADDGTYYAYGTETPEDVVPIARSDDLYDWEYVTAALESKPDWRTEEDAGVWAPDINYYDDQYYLYYSYSTWGSQDNPGIGLATADTPTGPFEDQGPVFRAEDLGETNTIDPDFNVVDGTPYMVWGSWYGIEGVRLTESGDDYVEGTVFELAGDHREAPYVIRENGYYYLFVSTGHCCRGYESTYGVEVGRAEAFEGPYVTPEGTDLRELNAHHSGYSVLSATDRFTGPGHNGAIRDERGDWWMLYHVEATEEAEVRTMMLDRIQWTDDDWPVVACNGHPSASSPVPGADYDCDAATFESSLQTTTTSTAAGTSADTTTDHDSGTGEAATGETTPVTSTATSETDGVPWLGMLIALAGVVIAAAVLRARSGDDGAD